MNHLHHCKLINLHDAFEDEDEMVLIFEFLSGGELFERITAEGYTMSEAEVINYMRQICEGVKHMHERNIIHLDIKPENVMCTTSKSTSVKIIDFGLATKLDPNELVKISTGTAEFAAPEIVEREAVGFFTDMWAVGVLSYVLLSGLSPFAGASDIDTLKNVKACDWSFDEEAFKNVSEEGRDFIRKLLVKKKEARLTAHECLLHPWLTGDHSHKTLEIARNRFFAIREKIRQKYANWNDFVLPMGRMSEFSSLRKLQMEKYRMQEVLIDRKCAAPRFVIKPQSTFTLEGQSARFTCRIISLTNCSVSWYHNNVELRQSVKYMKRYIGDDYTFIINRCKVDDRGEFIIHAENHYGVTEEPVFLNVQPVPKDLPRYEPEPLPVRKREINTYKLYKEEKESAPMFTFHLRPRVMQEGSTCKLLCCLTGNPHPAIQWTKSGKPLDNSLFPITHTDGVITIEIINCQPSDSGKYKCIATNSLGSDSTDCVVIVEGNNMSDEQKAMSDSILYSDRRFTDSTNRIGNAPTVRIQEPSKTNGINGGVNAADVSEALTNGKSKKKAYRRSDSTNSVGARSRGHTKELALPPDDSLMCPPSFLTGLKPELSIKDGSRLELKVQVKGDPDPQVTWLKDGTPISSNEIMEVKYKNGCASVIINEVFPEDGGKYTCKATNTKGSVETSSKVIKHIQSTLVKDGDPITLSCTIGGADRFDVVWLHNEKEIKPSKDFEYKSVGNVHSLIISEIFPEDSGTYTCEAFNDIGECFSTCTLVVDVPGEEVFTPRFTKFPSSLTVERGSSASFEAELNSAPTRVMWMKDGKEVKEQPMKHRITSKGSKVTLDILECSTADAGQYALIVSNKKGDSKSAFSLNV